MPLDSAARQYAKTLYVDELERLSNEHSKLTAEINSDFIKRGLHTSGPYFSALANEGTRYVEALANALVDSRLRAHEHSHLTLDDQSVSEILRDATALCDAQGKNVATNVRGKMAGTPARAAEAISGRVEHTMSGAKARIRRRLEIARYEQTATTQETTTPIQNPPDPPVEFAEQDDTGPFKLEHAHERLGGRRYYWEYLKRFGKESSETWWKDFAIALLLAILPVVFAWGDRTVLQGALLTLEAIALLFGVVALRHLVHTSFILFRERAHPEYGGIRYTHWGYGCWGAGILLVLAALVYYAGSHRWLRKPPPVVLSLPAPLPPTFTMQVVRPSEPHGARSEYEPTKTGASQTPAQNSASQGPSHPPTIAQSPPPATFLDRVVQENRALTPDDRNRFSTELYECDQFIKHAQDIGYKENQEFGKISNDRGHGALASTVGEHIKTWRDLDSAAQDEYQALVRFQQKWQYFADKTEYVFGDNPFNAGVSLLQGAAGGMVHTLTAWSNVSSRDQNEIINMESDQQTDCERYLKQFFDWTTVTLQRVKQMRESLDPNGVVEPIRPNTPAPAPAAILGG